MSFRRSLGGLAQKPFAAMADVVVDKVGGRGGDRAGTEHET